MHGHYAVYHTHQQIVPGTAIVAYVYEGFEPPMDKGPVKVKKNRVLPLKVKLIKYDGSLVADQDIISPPVLLVSFISLDTTDPVDVSDMALSAGQGDEGNTFTCTDDGTWQYNLKTSNYSAPGTYYINIVSGDSSEYTLSGDHQASFVIQQAFCWIPKGWIIHPPFGFREAYVVEFFMLMPPILLAVLFFAAVFFIAMLWLISSFSSVRGVGISLWFR